MPPSRRRFHRDNTEEQAELNRVDNDDHVIPMENYDINNTVDDDGTNRLIKDIYNSPMDDDVNLEDNLQDDNDDSDEDNDDKYILDKPILQNAIESLIYEGTKKVFYLL